jgi:hypothetical protein
MLFGYLDVVKHFFGEFVHHLGMIGAYELTVNPVACDTIDGVPINLTIAIDGAGFAREELVLGMNMERVG